MKKIFYLPILLICLWSCQDEDYSDMSDENSKAVFTKKSMNFNQFLSEMQHCDLSKSILNSTLNENEGAELFRSGENNQSIAIDTTNLELIEFENHKFYTFYVENHIDSVLTNLVIHLEDNNIDYEKFVSYHGYDENTNSYDRISISEPSSSTGILRSYQSGDIIEYGGSCYSVSSICEYGYEGHYDGHPQCTDATSWSYYFTPVPCPFGSAGGSGGGSVFNNNDTNDDNNNDSSTPSGGGSVFSDNYTDRDILTSPLKKSLPSLYNLMPELLSFSDKEYIDTEELMHFKLAGWLQQSNTQENKIFIDWAVYFLRGLFLKAYGYGNPNQYEDRNRYVGLKNMAPEQFILELKKEKLTQELNEGLGEGNLPLGIADLIEEHPSETEIVINFLNDNGSTDENKIIAKVVLEMMIAQDNDNLESLEYEWPSLNELKQKLQQAITEGVVSTAELMRKVYILMKKETDEYPWVLPAANYTVDKLREFVNPYVNYSQYNMDWKDLFLIWLFELGIDYPIINGLPTLQYAQGSNLIVGTTLSDPNTNAVKNLQATKNLRVTITEDIQANELNVGGIREEYFTYNVSAFYSTLQEQNLAVNILGSFSLKGKVLSINGNSATVEYTLENVSGWESATRLRRDGPDADSSNDEIIENKLRGEGINLGGTIQEIFKWQEVITW